jgi:hypothetical protein
MATKPVLALHLVELTTAEAAMIARSRLTADERRAAGDLQRASNERRILARMTPEQRTAYLAKKEAKVKAKGAKPAAVEPAKKTKWGKGK